MDIWQIDKLLLFLVLFVPGFISMRVYDLLIPGERRDFSNCLFEAIGYSALNFAALSWFIVLVHSAGFPAAHPVWYGLSLAFILFVAPALWPWVCGSSCVRGAPSPDVWLVPSPSPGTSCLPSESPTG